MTNISSEIPIKGLKSGKFVFREKHHKAYSNKEKCDHPARRNELLLGESGQSTKADNADRREKSPERTTDEKTTGCVMTLTQSSLSLSFSYLSSGPSSYLKLCENIDSDNLGPGKVTLECTDITAVDLRVTSKFGTWDTMVGRIVIECRSPVRASTTYQTPSGQLIEGAPLNCRMVKATFPIEYLKEARDMLYSLKAARNREMRVWKENRTKGVTSAIRPVGKVREGLPEWVNYIPYKWYSSQVRKAIEYLLVLYTLLSLLWALWQLYKHVDFVKAYLRPILAFLEYYISIMKSWLAWLDDFTTVMSRYWWNYMKPFYIIFVTAMAPMIQLFAPFKSIINLLPRLLDPFIQLFNIVYTFLQPLLSPLYSLFDIVLVKGVKVLFSGCTALFGFVSGNVVVKFLVEKGSQTYLVRILTEILHGKLDPIKAQVVVIRDLIFKSLKSIYFGGKFISSRIYYMVIFVKREQEYTKEEEINLQSEEITKISTDTDRNKFKSD